MNIIKQQREDIIRENNTAQASLLDILESLNKRADTLDIREPLHGDLDFSVLKELEFNNIKSIILEEGEVTNINNIPEGVTILKCPKNMLFSLENLPSSLTQLEIPYNYLTTIDLSVLQKLQILDIEHNILTTLENFPPELTEIYCQNNQLSHLDLNGLEKLNVLNISNNNITIIENLPENITDFQFENTPSIEFRNSHVLPEMNGGKKTEEESTQQSINYAEGVDKYFKLKSAYETKLYKAQKNAYESTNNKKTGRKKAQLVKGACIGCKRKVNTQFLRQKNRYIALCGDTENPCNLNIEIYHGYYTTNDIALYVMKEHIDNVKDRIIEQKLDTLFSYVSEADSIQQFKKSLEDFNQTNAMFLKLTDAYNENHNNEHKKELIQKKKGVIFMLTERLQTLLDEYKKTENRELIKTAIRLQVDDLLPETRNLRLLMNEHMEINEIEKSKGVSEYHLFRRDVPFTKDDYTTGEQGRVIKFSMK
jgi:hypothetical protein